MLFPFISLKSPRTLRSAPERRRFRPVLEVLEDRRLLSHGLVVEDFQLDSDPTQPGVASSIFQHSRINPLILDYETAGLTGAPTSAPHALYESDSRSVNVVTFSEADVDFASVAVNAFSQYGSVTVEFVGTLGIVSYRQPAPPGGLELPAPGNYDWVIVDTDPANTGFDIGRITEVRLGGEGVFFDDLAIHILTPPPNHPPVAVDDEEIAVTAKPVEIRVLANDSDADGDSLTIIDVSPVSHGTTTVHDNIITYTSNERVHGAQTFTYTVDDGHGGQATATVTVDVLVGRGIFIENFSDDSNPSLPGFDTSGAFQHCVTRSPSQPPPYVTTATHGDGYDILNVSGDHRLFLFGATDQITLQKEPDESVEFVRVEVGAFSEGYISFIGQNGTYSIPFHGRGVVTFSVAAGQVLPSGLELGSIQEIDLFGFEVSLDDVTVLIVAPQLVAPPIAGDDFATTEPGVRVLLNVLANDSGDALILPDQVLTPSNGGAASISPSHYGVIEYSPAPGFRGAETFTYTVFDNEGNSVTATVHMTVNTPPIAVPDRYEIPHAYLGAFQPPFDGGLLANDQDADGDPLRVVQVGNGEFGTVTFSEDGQFTYTPTTPDGIVRHDEFTYQVSDGLHTSETLVVIDVPNLRASDGIIAARHREPTPLRGSFAYFDLDNVPITASVVAGPSHGSVTLTVGFGHVAVHYETELGRTTGPDRFTYVLSNQYGVSNTATVEISVPNQAPIAIGDHFAMNSFEAIHLRDYFASTVNGRKHDLSVGALTLDVDDPRFYGDLTHLWPGPDYSPRMIDDFDPDGDPLTFSIVVPPVYGTLPEFDVRTGDFIYRAPSQLLFPQRDPVTGLVNPDLSPLEYGYDWFVYSTFDGYEASEAVVLIEFNDKEQETALGFNTQIYANDDAYELRPGQSILSGEAVNLFANGLASTGPYLSEEPRHGALELGLIPDGITSGSQGFFGYEPSDPDFVGVDSFRYHVLVPVDLDPDEIPSSAQVLYPSQASLVFPGSPFVSLNSQPEPRKDYYHVFGGQVLTVSYGNGLLQNDFDPDSDSLEVVAATTPDGASIFYVGEGGGFIYQPDPGFFGTDSFAYTVVDPYGGSARAWVTIEVLDPAVFGDAIDLVTASGSHVLMLTSIGTTFANVQVTDEPPAPAPWYVEFPLGYIGFEVHGLTPGGSATVTVRLPEDAPDVNSYWKYGPSPGYPSDTWYRFPASFQPNEIVLHLVDGGLGDRDREPNGTIVDPGGPAVSLAPMAVESVVINDGGVQRSKINSLTVTFNGLVTLDSGAFELMKQGGGTVNLSAVTSVVAGKTIAELTFSGPDIFGGSLADGDYRLIVHSDRVHDDLSRALDGDGDGTVGGDRIDAFFRLFGDTDGDGDVDNTDFDVFQTTFKKTTADAGYLWFLDFDGDGVADGYDNGQFNRRRAGPFPRALH